MKHPKTKPLLCLFQPSLRNTMTLLLSFLILGSLIYTRRNVTISTAAFALFVGSLTVGACGPDPETLCKRLCDCGDCAEQEQQGCAEGLEDAEKDAENDECGAEYDTYVECLDENLECSAGGAN